jgi:hypothetical protein
LGATNGKSQEKRYRHWDVDIPGRLVKEVQGTAVGWETRRTEVVQTVAVVVVFLESVVGYQDWSLPVPW